MSGPLLRGSRCQCMACLDYFGSERGFDRHRIGDVGSADRRCLTAEELASADWVRDGRGFWLQPDPRRTGAGVEGASDAPPATHVVVRPQGLPDSDSQHV